VSHYIDEIRIFRLGDANAFAIVQPGAETCADMLTVDEALGSIARWIYHPSKGMQFGRAYEEVLNRPVHDNLCEVAARALIQRVRDEHAAARRRLPVTTTLPKELQLLMAEGLSRRAALEELGEAALERLVKLAHGDSGQAGVVRRFLLGLYHGAVFRFDLTDLRRLDAAVADDCLKVLAMDADGPRCEVHRRIPGVTAVIATWAAEAWPLEGDHADQ
jgi:hypothetical protein